MEKERISVHGTVSHASHAFRLHEQQGSTSEVNPTLPLQWEHLSNQTNKHPSFYDLVSYIPLFPPKPDPSAFIGHYRLLFRT